MTRAGTLVGSPSGSRSTETKPYYPGPLYPQLRPLQRELSQEEVASNQRARLIGAMIHAVATRGYAKASTRVVCALAGVSRRTLSVRFGSIEECFLKTYGFVVEGAIIRCNAAYGDGDDRSGRLRRAFQALAFEIVEKPEAARLALVEVLGAGPPALERMERTDRVFERMVAASFAEAPDAASLPPLIVKGIVGGVARVIRQHLLDDSLQELPRRADELLEWALCYRSPAAARLASTRLRWETQRAVRRGMGQRLGHPGDRYAQLLDCATSVAARSGYIELTVDQIVQDAEIDPEVFFEFFKDRDQCFLAALEHGADHARELLIERATGSEDWTAGVHRGMQALMAHLAGNPEFARIAFIEIFALGPTGIETREALLRQFADLLIDRIPASERPSALTVQASVGAVWSIVHHYVAHGAVDRLPELVASATYLALAPIIGAEAAVRATSDERTVGCAPARSA